MASVRPIGFHPGALDFIRAQSASIRRQIGEALRDLQKGVNLVFRGFQKKSQKTPAHEIDLARRRLREVLNAKIES
jgi:phage-related protein